MCDDTVAQRTGVITVMHCARATLSAVSEWSPDVQILLAVDYVTTNDDIFPDASYQIFIYRTSVILLISVTV